MNTLILTIKDNQTQSPIVQIDFSDFHNHDLAKELIRILSQKYENQKVSIKYIQVLYVAARHYDSFLKNKSININRTPYQYNREEYREYLNSVDYDGKQYSDKYINFLVFFSSTLY